MSARFVAGAPSKRRFCGCWGGLQRATGAPEKPAFGFLGWRNRAEESGIPGNPGFGLLGWEESAPLLHRESPVARLGWSPGPISQL